MKKFKRLMACLVALAVCLGAVMPGLSVSAEEPLPNLDNAGGAVDGDVSAFEWMSVNEADYFNNCGVETVDAEQGIYKIGSFENDYRDFRYNDVYMEGATSLLVKTSKHMSRPLNMRVYVDSVSEENMVGEVIGLERYMTDSTGTNPNEHFAYYEIELNRTLTGTHQLIITTVLKGEIPEGINSNNEHIFAVKLVGEPAPTDPEATEPEATEPDDGMSVKAEAIEGNVAIDGKLDEAFWTVQGTLEKQTGGQNIANTVTFGTAWDETYLYVGANVIDATVFGTSDVNHWDNDAIEVFIDGNNDKSGPYDAHDVQYLVAWGKDTLFASAAGKDEGVLWAIEGTDEGYVVEMAVPWAVLDVEPELGMEIGFDVVNDDRISADGVRVGSLTWAGDGNNYASTSNFGSLVLVDDIGETQPTEPEGTTAPSEPEETTAPSEPEETTAPSEPEETTVPTEPEATDEWMSVNEADYFDNCGVETVDAEQGIYKIGSFENDYREFSYDDVYMEGATSVHVKTSKHMNRPLNMRVYVDSVSEENMVGEVIGLERYMTDSTGTNPNEHFAYYEIELDETLTGTHKLIFTTVLKSEIPEGIESNNEHIFAVMLEGVTAPTDPEATEPEATDPEATEPEATEPAPTDPNGPDLVVEDLLWSPWNYPKAGEEVVFRAKIRNNGAALPADYVYTVNFYLNDELVARSETVTAQINNGPFIWANVVLEGKDSAKWLAEKGAYTAKAVIDPENSVVESNETNNVKERDLHCDEDYVPNGEWIIDCTDPGIIYQANGMWLWGDSWGDLNGTCIELGKNGDKFTYTFTGASSLRIYSQTHGHGGNGTVTLNGVNAGTINCNGPDGNKKVVYAKSGLDKNETYTMVVTMDNAYVYIDHIVFNEEDLKFDSIADLKGLMVYGQLIDGFDSAVEEYDYKLPYGTTALPPVTATPEFEGSVVEVTYPETVNGTVVVTVTSRDGSNVKEFKINFTVDDTLESVPDLDGWLGFEKWYAYEIGQTHDSSLVVGENREFVELTTSAKDIQHDSDNLYYLFTEASGDVDFRAKITGPHRDKGWAKSGLIIRDGLTTSAVYASVLVPGNRAENGIRMQSRETAGQGTHDSQRGNNNPDSSQYIPEFAPEYLEDSLWIRLVRNGNTFTSYTSADGEAWDQVDSRVLNNMPEDFVIGFGCANSDNVVASFDSVSIETIDPADKAALNELIATIEAMDLSGYTANTVNALNGALASAKAVAANEDLTEYDQAVVDAAVTELQAAADALVVKANTDELGNLVTEVEGMDLSGYTDASAAALAGALAAAKTVLADKNLTADNQGLVDAALAALAAAIDGLEEKPTEPEATEPEATEPEATEPEATEPEATEPEATEPEATEPEATEPEATEPEATEPEATEPEATEPEETDPAQPSDPTKPADPDSPSTGDSIFFWIPVFVVTLMAAAALVWVRRREA